MSETARTQAEGLQFLREYRSAFTTRGDGSQWPKYEQTWLNAAQYFRGLLRPGSYTTTDIADKMHTDQNWNELAEQGYNTLPENARAYIEYVSKEIELPVYAVSVGPDRTETIVLRNPFGLSESIPRTEQRSECQTET